MNIFSMRSVETKAQLETLIQNTYIEAFIFAVIAFFIALCIANVIKWQGKPDRSHVTRRIWWIVIGVIIPMIFWLINATYVSGFIEKASHSSKFGTANVLATLCCLGAYFIASLITMFIFRSTKWGSILGSSKKN